MHIFSCFLWNCPVLFCTKSKFYQQWKTRGSQWKAMLRNDVRFPTVIIGYCCKCFTLSNQTIRYICRCIRMCIRSLYHRHDWIQRLYKSLFRYTWKTPAVPYTSLLSIDMAQEWIYHTSSLQITVSFCYFFWFTHLSLLTISSKHANKYHYRCTMNHQFHQWLSFLPQGAILIYQNQSCFLR